MVGAVADTEVDGPAVRMIFEFSLSSEFEGLVAITDLEETSKLTKPVESSSIFIKRASLG
jgi:hypothetical protein